MKKYKTIDLCAGIGGIRKGFELTGKCENVLSAENDKFACETYKHLFKENAENDITQKSFKEKINNIEYDILLAGFPCQAFSAVGKQEGFKDKTRGTLFFHIAEIIEKTRPKSFLLENVEGLINHDKGKTFKIILETLMDNLDYHIIGIHKNSLNKFYFDKENIVLNAKNFGLPQNRPRVYIVGFDKKRYGDKLKNIPLKQLPQKNSKTKIYSNLNQLLDFKNNEKFYLAEGYLNTLKKHKNSQKRKGNGFGYMIVNEPSIKNPIANTILATGGSGKERNLVYDPQKNIAGKTIKGKKTPLNKEGIRMMTPDEWAKLQGFLGYAFLENNEEKFSFPNKVSNTQRYKQLGNSVAIPVIEEIALKITQTLDLLEN